MRAYQPHEDRRATANLKNIPALHRLQSPNLFATSRDTTLTDGSIQYCRYDSCTCTLGSVAVFPISVFSSNIKGVTVHMGSCESVVGAFAEAETAA